jgi:hypothetical protein
VETLREMRSAAETVVNFSGETKVESAAHAELVKYVAQIVTSLPGSERALTEVLSSGVEQPGQQEIVREVLQQMAPTAALPALLQSHALAQTAGNQPAAKAVEQVILEYARTEVGQKAVVAAFANAKEQPLVSSEIGQKAILTAVRQIAASPVIAEAKTALPVVPTAVEKAVNNIREIAKANPVRLAPTAITVENAKALVGLAVRIERSLETVSKIERNVSVAKRAKAAAARRKVGPVNQQSGIVNSMARRSVNRNPVIQARYAVAQQALKAVMRAADAGSFILPKTVIEHLYAGLAGVNLVPAASRPVSGAAFQSPAESRSASTLRHVVQALEAQATRAISSKDPVAWSKVFTLSAQVMLYGIIMRLVRGRMDQVDRVIELLKKKQELARVVAKIKQGDLDAATDDLYSAVMEASLFSELIAA